jgi:hypothetical protein
MQLMQFPSDFFPSRDVSALSGKTRDGNRLVVASFCRETGLIPRSASRCRMIARVERVLRRAFNKRAQKRPLHLERFATETSLERTLRATTTPTHD